MTRTVVGLFDDFGHAKLVVSELTQAGIAREDISLVTSDSGGELAERYGKYLGHEKTGAEGRAKPVSTPPVGARSMEPADTAARDSASSVASGAGAGALIGGATGLVAGLVALAIPGVGPVLAVGPLVTALMGAGLGAAAGGLIGGLTTLGVPESEAHQYVEGVRRGGTLVVVRSSDELAGKVADIMHRNHAVDIHRRAGQRG